MPMIIGIMGIMIIIISFFYMLYSLIIRNEKLKKGITSLLIGVIMFFSGLILEGEDVSLLSVFIVDAVLIYFITIGLNHKEMKANKEKIHKEIEVSNLLTPISYGKMTYHGGGLIETSTEVSVWVLETGLEYKSSLGKSYFIDKENIEDVVLDTQSQMSTHVKQRVTATRMVLLGPFALAVPKSKSTQVEKTSKFLGIDYSENGDKYTLLLEGENATQIQFALRKMKSLDKSNGKE